MRQITTTITQRGQVTIPAEVRRRLGVGPRDKVAFAIDDDGVHLFPAPFTLESAFGSVTPKHTPEDFKTIERAARAERVDQVLSDFHES
ncbi:MAG TPA: type II toxin-antitoxin system PrlF family antitoxin [Chloroflexota bacterium]|nr:type II toxin-antitoxin system PrlF family antitoxin [Chloroflexota bacterium]